MGLRRSAGEQILAAQWNQVIDHALDRVADGMVEQFQYNPDGTIAMVWVREGVLMCAGFEGNETWVGGTADMTNKKVGNQGRKLSPTASQALNMTRTITLTLASHDYIDLWVYLDNVSRCASVDIRFRKDASNYFNKNVLGASLVTGWNYLHFLKSEFTQTGTLTWAEITSLFLQATANSSGALNVTFDDLIGVKATANLYATQEFTYSSGLVSTSAIKIYTESQMATVEKTVTDTYAWVSATLIQLSRTVT